MKIRINYQPDGQALQQWDFDPEELTGPEAELIEGAGGEQWATLGEWFDMFVRSSWRARKVVLWVLLLRTNPELGFEELAAVRPKTLWGVPVEEEDPGKDQPGEEATEPSEKPTGSESPDSSTAT